MITLKDCFQNTCFCFKIQMLSIYNIIYIIFMLLIIKLLSLVNHGIKMIYIFCFVLLQVVG